MRNGGRGREEVKCNGRVIKFPSFSILCPCHNGNGKCHTRWKGTTTWQCSCQRNERVNDERGEENEFSRKRFTVMKSQDSHLHFLHLVDCWVNDFLIPRLSLSLHSSTPLIVTFCIGRENNRQRTWLVLFFSLYPCCSVVPLLIACQVRKSLRVYLSSSSSLLKLLIWDVSSLPSFLLFIGRVKEWRKERHHSH